MTKTLFALMLAGTFMVPHITPAVGNESATELPEFMERLLLRNDGIPSAYRLFLTSTRCPGSHAVH
jgi:hypothetical protein